MLTSAFLIIPVLVTTREIWSQLSLANLQLQVLLTGPYEQGSLVANEKRDTIIKYGFEATIALQN